jgi:hypothetical protein
MASTTATRAGVACLVLWVGVAAALPVHAQPEAVQKAVAEALFREGRHLMSRRRFDEACPKFAESQRLDPAPGTLLNLGLCHEKVGKLASAWVELHEALALARRDGHARRVTIASEHLAVIEPRVPRIVLELAPELAAASIEVLVDDVVVGSAMLSELPLDPGEHRLEVRAPGKRSWRTSLTLAEGERRAIEVPVLEDEPGLEPAHQPEPALTRPMPSPLPPLVPRPRHAPLPPPEAPAPTDNAQIVAGWVSVGSGALALAIGLSAGVAALDRRGKSDDECPEERCTAHGAELNVEAQRAATVANVGLGIGLGLTALGAVLLLTAPESSPRATLAAARDGSLALCF